MTRESVEAKDEQEEAKVVLDIPQDDQVKATNSRYLYLESIRGIASFIVSLQHFIEVFVDPRRLTFNGIFIPDAFAGHYCVIVFFILSGNVLCTSMISTRDPFSFLKKTSSALLRRPIRLGIPVAVILIVSSLIHAPLSKYSPSQDIPSLTFFPQDWDVKRFSPVHKIASFWDVLLHIMALFTNGLSPGDIIQLNGVVWTIPIEFWGSIFTYTISVIVYPLRPAPKWIFFFVIAFFAWWNSSYNFLFLAGLMICHLRAEGHFYTLENSLRLFYPLQILFFLMWIILWFGAKLLVGHKDFLLDSYSFLIHQGILGGLKGKEAIWYDNSTSLSLSAICFLLLIEMNTSLQHWLSVKPLVFLGRISFSLYLSHFPLLGLFGLLWRALMKGCGLPYEWAVFGTYLVYFPTTLVVAYILTLVVDEPTVRFAKRSVRSLYVL